MSFDSINNACAEAIKRLIDFSAFSTDRIDFDRP
jgi:hypothetical protein